MTRISKAAILAACIKKQEDLIENFDLRIEEVQADIVARSDDPPSQADDDSSTAEDLLSVLREEMAFVQAEMSILRGIDPQNGASEAERGAVVVTDRRTFFIGVSSEEVEVEGQKVFGMSDKAPLYAYMKGLKKGDSFEFNKTAYTILDVY